MPPSCICQKDPCPLNSNCLVDKVIYKATVTTNNTVDTYTGLTGNTFKARHGGHKTSLNSRLNYKSTTLSKHIWKLKDGNHHYEIDWSIKDRAQVFNQAKRKSIQNGENKEDQG